MECVFLMLLSLLCLNTLTTTRKKHKSNYLYAQAYLANKSDSVLSGIVEIRIHNWIMA